MFGAAFVAYLALWVVIGVLERLLLGAVTGGGGGAALAWQAVTELLDFTVLIFIGAWLRKGLQLDFRQAGLSPVSFRTGAVATTIGILSLAAGAAGANFVADLASLPESVHPDLAEAPAREPLRFALLVVGTGLLTPVAEEFIFRGVLQGWLQARYSDRVAVIVTSVAFAFIHVQPRGVLLALVVGAVLSLARVRTGSILPTVLTHGMFNIAIVTTRHL